jgi:hypothetical protein
MNKIVWKSLKQEMHSKMIFIMMKILNENKVFHLETDNKC